VNCRPVGGEGKGNYVAHCAVRVVDADRGIDQTIELIPKDGQKEIYWSNSSDNKTKAYDANAWVSVGVPQGLSSREFDDAVMLSAGRETRAQRGTDYTVSGTSNSNRFVYNVITGAGGRVPRAAAAGFFYGAPGLCGGKKAATGRNCSP